MPREPKDYFALRKPCAHCPFSQQTPGFLTEGRAEEIVYGLLAGQTFDCHKTVQWDEEDDEPLEGGRMHCAGAAMFLENQDQPNQMMRWYERLGGYDREKLIGWDDSFDDAETFIEYHVAGNRR